MLGGVWGAGEKEKGRKYDRPSASVPGERGNWGRVWARGDGWTTSCPQAPHLPPSPAGSRVPSIENVLQDGSPEPCGRSQPGAPADVYLPGKGGTPEVLESRRAALLASEPGSFLVAGKAFLSAPACPGSHTTLSCGRALGG